ncbi:MAG: signal peptidase I [Nitrososphaeria archaeon]|jgi:signal peptidase
MGNSVKKHWKKIEIAEDIVIVVLFITLAILLINVAFGNSPFWYVEGISMHPTLQSGDLIIIVRTPFDNLKVGDIIVYYSHVYNFRIVHRIIEIENISGQEALITKGDNNLGPDPLYVTKADYIGKYTGIRIPYVGFLYQALAPPVNYFIIAVLVIYLIYIDLYTPLKNKQNASKAL